MRRLSLPPQNDVLSYRVTHTARNVYAVYISSSFRTDPATVSSSLPLFHSVLCLESLYTECKGKAVPLQAWRGPEGSKKLRFSDFMTTTQDGGKVVRPTHRPPLHPRKYFWFPFLLEAESTPGPMRPEGCQFE